jgi:S1-C subfamily serine protease
MGHKAWVVLFAFASANLHISTAYGFDIPDLAAKAKPSVLLLSCTGPTGQKTSSGTGFFVSSSGRIVTNHHVAKDCSGITATTSSRLSGTYVRKQC